MADQGVSNERKKELEQIDPFQAALIKGAAYASEHKKLIGMVLGVMVIVILALSTIMYSFKRSEIAASQLAAKASMAYAKAIAADDDPKAALAAVKTDFQTIMDEYNNTSAGKIAMISYAKICFDAGDYDKAYELYSQALSTLGKDAGMENFLLAALGNIAQLKKENASAKSYYLRIENGDSTLLKDEAQFALALIYEAENDTAAAMKMYEKIVKDHNNSIYLSIARAKLNGEKG